LPSQTNQNQRSTSTARQAEAATRNGHGGIINEYPLLKTLILASDRFPALIWPALRDRPIVRPQADRAGDAA
jgi:hypothetical protein